MAKICKQCKEKELFVKKSDCWKNLDTFEPIVIKIHFYCNSCGYEYIANQTFKSLNDYHNFLDEYKENV